MTILEAAAAPYLKPLPSVQAAHRPFFDALRGHQFMVPRCDDCGDYNWVPYPACRSCLSERQTWTRVSGNATLYTYTVCHRGPGAFAAEVPYVIALGELTEQPRPCLILGNLTGCPPEDIRIGMPMKIAYQDIPSEDITLWRWIPANG
jgi:uncharacterized OB-fold protein